MSVSGHLPRLNKNDKVFTVNKELPDQYVVTGKYIYYFESFTQC